MSSIGDTGDATVRPASMREMNFRFMLPLLTLVCCDLRYSASWLWQVFLYT